MSWILNLLIGICKSLTSELRNSNKSIIVSTRITYSYTNTGFVAYFILNMEHIKQILRYGKYGINYFIQIYNYYDNSLQLQ